MDPRILASFESFPGKTGFYYRNLCTGDTLFFQPDLPLVAASVIKLPIMVEAFRQSEAGLLNLAETVTVPRSACMPSCGVISYLHDNVSLPWIDLITLMIIVSDNTATNLLIDRLGIANVNQTMESLGLKYSRLNRKLFQPELSRQGIQNYVTAGDMGTLLQLIYEGKVVSPAACQKMIEILSCQQLNGKIPFYLHAQGIHTAHKTGEDSETTHDVGIVYGPEPFVVCFLSNDVDVTAFERLIQDTSLALLNETERMLSK